MGWSALGQEPLNSTATWHSEPSIRGTWNILSSCIITLGLCIWTSVHLNVPEQPSTLSQLWRKIVWVLLGLLAPEIVVYIAFHQNRAALYMHKDITKYLPRFPPKPTQSPPNSWKTFWTRSKEGPEKCKDPESRDSTSGKRLQHCWTRTHSAHGIMGGFAFDTSRFPSDGPLDGHREWITLSPKGLTFLAKNEPDLISNISKQQIEDKSKASDLVKAFAGVQILWFCAQVTTRLASALPITLLELNTFAHCLCALLIYFLWWNKPFDVEAPTLIPIPDHKSKTICAAMYMRSSIGMRKPLREPYIEGRKGRRLTEAVLEFEDECDEGIFARMQNQYLVPSTQNLPHQLSEDGLDSILTCLDDTPKSGDMTLNLFEPQKGLLFRHLVIPHWARMRGGNWCYKALSSILESANTELSVIISSETLTVCRFAREAITAYQDFQIKKQQPEFSLSSHCSNTDYVWAKSNNFLLSQLPYLRGSDGNRLAGIGLVALSLYGAIHSLAWNGPFHSAAEAVLWKLSVATLTAVAPAVIVLFFIVSIGDKIEDKWKTMPFRCGKCLTLLLRFSYFAGLAILAALYIGLYFLARVYLVVECFISLPYAPASAFVLPSWPAYFPHLG